MPRRSETGLNLIRLVMAIIGFRLIGYSSYSPANIYNTGANRPYAVISSVSAVLVLHPYIPLRRPVLALPTLFQTVRCNAIHRCGKFSRRWKDRSVQTLY